MGLRPPPCRRHRTDGELRDIVSIDSFGARAQLDVGSTSYEIFRLDALDTIAEMSRP